MGRMATLCGRAAGVLAACVKYGCIVHCSTEYVADVVICTGPSMEPTISSHDVIVTEKISPLRQRIAAGDIVVVRSPSSPRHNICKRVTAVAGERVGARGQHLVPRGHLWLEGDNAANSNDSRSFGAVPAGLVRGRALLKLWPPGDAGLFDAHAWRRRPAPGGRLGVCQTGVEVTQCRGQAKRDGRICRETCPLVGSRCGP
ncbi:mitochondrial inner membrane protease subunit 1-like [Pollicipes pollicipes]|uniref:mitochondrial inner membrane protease subunit 1-like n=1 Tax=Pollicipes pollicipes TaxID=41117 RepID=UPI001884EFFB|nr:mitochondrial inner membrane protease subunit 1-like [Pollicipes pollicipes]XP_037082496.1 mitochondrial inner membrane protease subunit 1-like [Pollicipes pollicipes]